MTGMLACQRVGDEFFLVQDFSMKCFSPEHNYYRRFAFFFLVVFPLGVPVFFMCVLWRFGVISLARRIVDDAWCGCAPGWTLVVADCPCTA